MLKILTDLSRNKLFRVVLFILFFALIGASLVSLFEGSINEEFSVLGDAVWWVLVTMTTVGYGDKVPITTGGKIVGIVIMFFGVALLSLFTATISSIFITKKIQEGRGLEDIKFKDHLIICGWNFSAEQILTQLDKNNDKIGPVVLINQLGEEIISDIISGFSSLKIKFVRGDHSKEAVLNRANVQMAQAVVLLPDTSGGIGSRSDEQTILSALTIKSINFKTKVFAYIIDRENLSHIHKARADEVMVSDAYAGYLMASHILSPGVPQMVDQLCSEEGLFNLSRLEIPPSLHGKTYGELTEIFKADYNAFALGLGREEEGMDIRNVLSDDYSYLDQFIKRKFEKAGRGIGEESKINIRINPSSDTPIDVNDFLIAIIEGGNK